MRDNEPPAPPGSEAGARSGSNGHDLRGRRRCHPCRWGVLGSSLSAHARRGGDVSPPLRAQDPVTGAIRTDPADRVGPRDAGPLNLAFGLRSLQKNGYVLIQCPRTSDRRDWIVLRTMTVMTSAAAAAAAAAPAAVRTHTGCAVDSRSQLHASAEPTQVASEL